MFLSLLLDYFNPFGSFMGPAFEKEEERKINTGLADFGLRSGLSVGL